MCYAQGSKYITKAAGNSWHRYLERHPANKFVNELSLESGLHRVVHKEELKMVIRSHIDELFVPHTKGCAVVEPFDGDLRVPPSA